MPQYSFPGVYIEEIGIDAKPIEGVSTSTAGFLGETERGPAHPILVTSWLEYQRIYGTYVGVTKYLPYAVEGFFNNGGKRCYIARVVSSGVTKASLTLTANNNAALVIEAIGEGVWGKRIGIRTKKNPDNKTFKLTAFYWKNNITTAFNPDDSANKTQIQPAVVEVFGNVSVERDSPNYFETVVNSKSNLITISGLATGNPAIPDDAASDVPVLLGNVTGIETSPTLSDFRGDGMLPPGSRRGLLSFEDIKDISILYVPNILSVSGLYDAVVAQCEKLRGRFAIIEVSKGTQNPNITTKCGMDTKYAALYCPWIKIKNPVSSSEILVTPGGHIAGIYARSDAEVGVHKAPANQVVLGAEGLEYVFSKSIQDTLNSIGVNCIREFTGRGIRVWGARTLSNDPLWKYVNIRRLFIFLEKSIENGTQWVVFEPNNEKLWAKVKQTISNFLTTVWKSGALMGTTPQEAFFVKCDRTTMTQDDIDNGRLIVVIGVAPLKPAEFVIFRIAQWQGGSGTTK
jgi:phage tail sheath protein FI